MGNKPNDMEEIQEDGQGYVKLYTVMDLDGTAFDLFCEYERKFNQDGRVHYVDPNLLALYCKELSLYFKSLGAVNDEELIQQVTNGKQSFDVINRDYKAAIEIRKNVTALASMLGIEFKIQKDVQKGKRTVGRPRKADPFGARLTRVG